MHRDINCPTDSLEYLFQCGIYYIPSLRKMWKTKGTISLGLGIGLIIIGVVIIVIQPNEILIRNILVKRIPLVNGTANFDIWTSVHVEFKVYIFHVVNSVEVQTNGDVATLVEYGPYVYDDHIERTVSRINEFEDTFEYTAKRTLIFNATKSGNFSEDDEITVINSAYLGTILTIAERYPFFLSSIGETIPLLFPDQKSIFVRGKVKDILFDGMPLICDKQKYPELTLICGVLNSDERPPIVRKLPEDGYYAWSYFHKLNGTNDGPYTLIRGVKDVYRAGYITEFKGSSVAEYWSEENCSVVKGTDSIFYPPMTSRYPEIFTFASDLCRSIHVDYVKDTVYNGVLGYLYRTSKNLWNGSESSCYCPRADDDTMQCPAPGLLELKKCQKAPVVMSEPHFLHGANSLFSLTKGLNPDEEKHAAYVVINPLTGAPLSGSRKMQLNMMLSPLPVNLLSNVSAGVFPLFWVDEGLSPDAKLMEPVILVSRTSRLFRFFITIPLILGVLLVIYSYWMNRVNETGYKKSGRSNHVNY